MRFPQGERSLNQLKIAQRRDVMLGRGRREAAERHMLEAGGHCRDFGDRGADGDARGELGWKTIDAG